MGWPRLIRSIKLQVSFAEYRLFNRALLQKRSTILSILLTKATPYDASFALKKGLWTHSILMYTLKGLGVGVQALDINTILFMYDTSFALKKGLQTHSILMYTLQGLGVGVQALYINRILCMYDKSLLRRRAHGLGSRL